MVIYIKTRGSGMRLIDANVKGLSLPWGPGSKMAKTGKCLQKVVYKHCPFHLFKGKLDMSSLLFSQGF